MEPFLQLVEALNERSLRFVLVGVWGANFYARSGGTVFTTQDYDLFLPADAPSVLAAWSACEAVGLSLWCGDEPLDMPRDLFLAERIIERRALVRATSDGGLLVDLTLVMKGFDFEAVWGQRRIFVAEGVRVPVARLTHIVQSKAAVGRPKDRLFLATHEEALRGLMEREEESR